MAGILVTQGKTVLWEAFVNKTDAQDLILDLFTNDVTPNVADTEASYTKANGAGYAAITLIPATWSAMAYPLQTFTFTGPSANVYGYLLTQASSGILVGVERFSDGPYPIVNNGDAVKVTPILT